MTKNEETRCDWEILPEEVKILAARVAAVFKLSPEKAWPTLISEFKNRYGIEVNIKPTPPAEREEG